MIGKDVGLRGHSIAFGGAPGNDRNSKWIYLLVPAGIAVLMSAAALQLVSFRLSVLAIRTTWVACIIGFWALPLVRVSRRNMLLAALALLPFWFAGYDSPFHWDAVQTAIRAKAFWQFGTLERISPFYVILSPIASATPASSIPATVFVMCMGLITLGLVGVICTRLAGRDWGFRMVLVAAVMPIFYLLYRWVVLDTFFLLVWLTTLLCVFAWAPKLNVPRLIGLLLMTSLTVASKEMGAMILFPVGTGLIVLAPKEQRKARILVVAAIIAVVLPIAVFSLYRWAHLQGTRRFFNCIIYSARGLTFIPLNSALPIHWTHYLQRMVAQYVAFMAQMGLVLPIALALWRPTRRWVGWVLAPAAAAVQLLWMLHSRPDRWGDVHTYPFFDGSVGRTAFVPLFFFATLLLVLWISRNVRLRIDKKSWILLAAIVPGSLVLIVFMKADRAGGDQISSWMAWNYPIVLLASGVLLAARGLRQIGKYRLPRPILWPCLLVLMITCMNFALHGVGMAVLLRSVDRAYQRTYDWMRTQPERVVYTHWPFIYESPGLRYINMDNGGIAWQRDGWRVCSIRPFGTPSFRGEPGAFILWDSYRPSVASAKRLKTTGDQAYSENGKIWRMSLFSRHPQLKVRKIVTVRRIPKSEAASSQ